MDPLPFYTVLVKATAKAIWCEDVLTTRDARQALHAVWALASTAPTLYLCIYAGARILEVRDGRWLVPVTELSKKEAA